MTDEIKRAKREIKGYGKKKEIQNPTKVKRMNMHRHKKKLREQKEKACMPFFPYYFTLHTQCALKKGTGGEVEVIV